jgi:ribosome maturation factor RimP
VIRGKQPLSDAPVFELEHFARYRGELIVMLGTYPVKDDGKWRYWVEQLMGNVIAVDERDLEKVG